MDKKKIIFLTGKRGGYDSMIPLLNLLKKNKKIDLSIVATDQHTKKQFGNTIENIHRDFSSKKIFRINSSQKSDSLLSRTLSFANLIKKFSFYLKKNQPDLLILYGDRGESVIAAIVANNFEIPICHFQGGDLSGNIDENFRHAITKLSNYHFASNTKSRNRLLQLGEEKKKCFNFGDAHIDALKQVNTKKNSFDKIKIKLQLPKKYVVFLLHPEEKKRHENWRNAKVILKSLKKTSKNIIAIYPCTDAGYLGIVKSIHSFKKKYKKIQIFRNIEYADFINVLKNSEFLIGNSSSGVIESAYLRLPVINIGNRQKNRLKPKNVFNLKFNETAIIKKIKEISKKNLKRPELYYGSGNSYKRSYNKILEILKTKVEIYKNFYER